MFRIDNENRQIVYGILVFLICYILLGIVAMRPVLAFDTFWHLQMGKDFLEQGLSPWVDHYSFSYPGKEIFSIPVIFQVLLYKFVSFFGEDKGFYFIKLFYITLLMLALFAYFRKINANGYIVLLLLPIIASAIPLRLIIRPDIFSNVLTVICLILYLNARKKFATREMLYISLLLLFWVNYHSPIIGYIIIFGLFIDRAINKIVDKDTSFSWTQWCLWGAVIFLIGFIKFHEPYFIGQHFAIGMINVMSEGFGKYTQEYKDAYYFYSTDILVHVSWALSAYVAIWSLIKKQYGFVFIAVLLTYFSWSLSRLVTVVILVNMCILALYFTQVSYSQYLLKIRPSLRKALYAVSFSIALLAFYFLVKQANGAMIEDENRQQILEQRYPVQVTDYLKNYQTGGNILNVMQYGGYLINKLSPEFKVYFDGRTNILYPIEFVEHNQNIWRDKKIMNEVIDRYGVKYAIRKNTPEIFGFFQGVEKLKLGFADDNYLLFVEDDVNAFPRSSLLMVFPACWNDDWQQDIQDEIRLSEELFEDKEYTLKYLLAFIQDYLSHEDKQHFFETLKAGKMHSDGVRRLAFHMALNTVDDATSSDLFAAIQLKNTYDILIYSHYLAEAGRFTDAENLLFYFFADAKDKKKAITFDKIIIMYRVLRILDKNIELQHFDPAYLRELEDKMNSVNYDVNSEFSFDYICK